ncbi:hypothetical protein LMG19083_03734 [Ralstonia psammae]|uniref:Uncharacterized protein n=1 Tax=Ralstonia psammae TaxID=3058598 RepID=A0ABN9J819_9RALS|nr:hypothetical protein [Ralstonia sp. LMG 19083]CAJ0802484.1 hypothetical protein LMG19083_03734 [Ralstonia sp. LMG 19083]
MNTMHKFHAGAGALLLASAPALTWAAGASAAQQCTTQAALQNKSIKVEEAKALFVPKAQNLTATSTTKDLLINGDQLNEFEATLTTYEVKADGTLTVLTNSASAEDKDFLTIYSFKQYRSDGNNKYGISIRLDINYHSSSGAISLANLFGFLSASGNASKFKGNLSLSAHGLVNPKIAALLPVPAKLDDSAAAQYFSYMGALKGLITDKDTTIDPVLLSPCA